MRPRRFIQVVSKYQRPSVVININKTCYLFKQSSVLSSIPGMFEINKLYEYAEFVTVYNRILTREKKKLREIVILKQETTGVVCLKYVIFRLIYMHTCLNIYKTIKQNNRCIGAQIEITKLEIDRQTKKCKIIKVIGLTDGYSIRWTIDGFIRGLRGRKSLVRQASDGFFLGLNNRRTSGPQASDTCRSYQSSINIIRTNVLKRFENQGPFIFYSYSLCVI